MECLCLRPDRLKECHLHVTFARLAIQQPRARCVIDWDGSTISYGQISLKAREISCLIEGALKRRGTEQTLGNGDSVDGTRPRIGVYMPRSAVLVATILAIHHSGCVYVPLDADFPIERHKKCASIAGFSLILSSSSSSSSSNGGLESEARDICNASSDPCMHVCVDATFSNSLEEDALMLPVDESRESKDEAAYIIFTSGTTGEPKPVCYPHIGLIDAVHNHAERLNVDPEKDVFELSYSISFDAHVHPVFVPLICGAALVMCKPHGHLDAAYWLDLVVRHSVTIVHTLPTLAVAYVGEMEKMPGAIHTIREWECMGENFPSNLASSLYSLLPNLSRRGCINGYGPTETFTVTHSFVKPEDTRISIGPPDPNVFCCVVDPETGEIISNPGVRGELLVSGPRVALGYLSDATKTAEKFVSNPAYDMIQDRIDEAWIESYFARSYRTGDLVSWMENGELELHGRIDRQVKIRGVRIELGEIESLLVSVEGVTGAAVDVRSRMGEKALVAWVTPEHVDPTLLYQRCSERLVQAAVPACIVPLESFPVASTGKVRIDALTVPEENVDIIIDENDGIQVDPHLDTVRKFWKRAFGLHIKDSSDFFGAGGNSIKAFKINAEIQSALGLAEPIPVALLYKHRTLRDFAQALESRLEENNDSESRWIPHTWSDSKRPLGKFQQQMWTVASIAGKEAAGAYNLSLCFAISDNVNAERLENAFQTVVRRHEILRTVYHVKPDGTLSGQLTHGSFGLSRVSVQNAQELKRLMKSEVNHYFDFQSDILLRATLVYAEHTPGQQYLIIVTHHAVSDAWSLGILCDELSLAYKNTPMDSLKYQYADYILWLNTQSNRGHVTYWTQELASIPERLDFPLDFSRPEVGGLEGTCTRFDFLSEFQLEMLIKIAREIGVSLNALLLAAFHVLLSKWSNSDDVVIGLPAAMRDIASIQNLIGYFVSPLPIRGQIKEKDKFGDFARSIHEKIMMGIKHGKLSFPEIVSAANVPPGSPFNPVFQVMFQYLEEEEPRLDFGSNIMISPYNLPDPELSQVDITFEVHAHDKGNAYLDVEYSTSILSAGKMNRLVDGYKTLLGSICTHGVHMPLDELNVLSKSAITEIDRLSRGPECLKYFEMPLMHDQFYTQVKQQPHSVCLLCDQRKHTYHETFMMVYHTIVDMRKVQPEGLNGKCVAVFASRSEELVISMLAIFFLGGVYLPLEPRLPQGRISDYLTSSGTQLILVSGREDSEDLRQKAEEMGVSTLVVSCDSLKGRVAVTSEYQNALPDIPVDFASLRSGAIARKDRACILFTSGSTGKPKGVVLTHGGVVDIVCGSYIDLFHTSREDVFALATSPAFDPHIAITLAALACGASLSIIPPGLETDARAVAEICVKDGITLMDQVPSLIELYTPELIRVRNSLKLRTLVFGGEPLPCSVAAELQKIPGLSDGIYNAYGPAEFTVSATAALMLPGVPDAPLGPPDPNVRAYVVSPDNVYEQKPIGAIGELLLSGPRTALGYINNEEQTKKHFIPNPFFSDDSPVSDFYRISYRTGDLVSRDENGILYFHGRCDGQIKINGVRIEISEVKHVVQSHPEVDLAHALAFQVDSTRPKQVVAFVTPMSVNKETIRDLCVSKLIPAAVPSSIISLDSFPLTPTGKINALELERIAGEDRDASQTSESWYIPPQTSTEEVVADTLKEILHYPDDISVEANFFELGGNSLQAGILSSRLRVHFDIDSLPATLVYQKKTIRGMAESIDACKHQHDSSANHAAIKPTDRLQADKELFLAPSEVVPTPAIPYWIYMTLQYIMLSLTMVMVPVIWGALLVGVFQLRTVINSWWLVLIWPSMKVGALFGYALLLITLKWVLVGNLKPGVYPLYGWMYARWVTLRALQEAAGDTFFPAILRTPFLSYILKALGAKIHSPAHVLVDSVNICDFDLLSFGKGCCIYSDASVTGAFVTPAGYLGRRPVLILSEVDIGENCQIGHRAVVTAGTTIADNHNLKPHASRSHPGDEPVNGPLSDFPHFCAEERLGALWSLVSGLTNHFLESLAEVPIVALCLLIIYSIIGDGDPLDSASGSVIAWNLVEFSALFTALYGWLNPALGVLLQMIMVLAWKWIFVGRLKPGVNVARSTYSLFVYSVLRRQVESPMWHDLQILLTGTPLMAWLYKALGASVGRHVFIGGLSIVEFDALEVSDKVCSGSDSVIFATNADGIVEKVVLKEEATIGNASVLYPGCEIHTRAVVGNDTPICRGRVLKDNVRAQGSLDYTVIRPNGASHLHDAMENGIELPYIVSHSQSHVDTSILLPWWHTPATLITLMAIGPIAPVLLWVPLAVVASLLKQTYWWLIPVAYVVMVGVGSLLAVLYLRLLLEASQVRRHWKHGSVSVFDIPSLLMHSYFNVAEANIDAFHGTPFAVYIYRILGFKVGKGAILLCAQPLESSLIEIGEDSVIESGGKLDGHYMEYQKFIYHSVRLGERCWVQEGARVMPLTVMNDGSRVMPASMVLPGDSLAEGSVWCGLPAEPIRTREVYHSKAKASRILKRSGKISRSSKKSKSGFLDSLASDSNK